MAAAAASYITRTSHGGSSSSLHHADITRITWTSRAAALRHHAAAAHSRALKLIHEAVAVNVTAVQKGPSFEVPSLPEVHVLWKTDLQEVRLRVDATPREQTFQYPSSIGNTRAHQHIYGTDNNPTMQSADDIYNTSQCANFINSTKSIQNTEDSAVFYPEDPVGTSPERDYQETPMNLTSTAQAYQQYYRLKNIPGSYTMPYYSDFENLNPDTITSASKTVKEARTLPPGEYIPVKKPEKKQLAFLKAQRIPVIDPNTCDSSSECNDTALKHFGRPADWSVNDLITVLKHLDPLLTNQLYPIIREHDIDGKALLLLNINVMLKYMKLKLEAALKFDKLIQKLKEGVYCGL
ncbi:hypothetical protein STEG23_013228 [Scotinomys teguina]